MKTGKRTFKMLRWLHCQSKIKQSNVATIEQLIWFHTLGRLLPIYSVNIGKIEEFIEEDQFGIRKGKGTTDAVGLMGIISENVLDVKKEMCLCFLD